MASGDPLYAVKSGLGITSYLAQYDGAGGAGTKFLGSNKPTLNIPV